jgi:hypothetical protein
MSEVMKEIQDFRVDPEGQTTYESMHLSEFDALAEDIAFSYGGPRGVDDNTKVVHVYLPGQDSIALQWESHKEWGVDVSRDLHHDGPDYDHSSAGEASFVRWEGGLVDEDNRGYPIGRKGTMIVKHTLENLSDFLSQQ